MSNVSLIDGHIDDEPKKDIRRNIVIKIEDLLGTTKLPWQLIYDPYIDSYHIIIN